MVEGVPFVVGDLPYCLWDWDIRGENLRFFEGVDPTYFAYLAQIHGEQLERQPQHAAIALRTAYHHGLESFFALLFAALQAPKCVFAWLPKYQVGTLRSLADAVDRGLPFRNRFGLQAPTWEAISEVINRFKYDDEARLIETRQLFATLWRRFSRELRDDRHSKEYNSIKHGFRHRAGGFGVAAGIETTPGVPAPPENMQLIGRSDFGSSYFVAQPIPARDKNTRHFRVQRQGLNWSPDAMLAALQLIAFSVGNVVSCVRLINGIPGKDVAFNRPLDSDFFEAPWRDSAGVLNLTVDVPIPEDQVRLLSNEELLEFYDRLPKV